MGAANSILEGCEWGSPLDSQLKFPFEMYPVTKPDGTLVTVFEPKNPASKDSDLLKKCASTLRGLRHPNIIHFISCGESRECFWLATESVAPLTISLPDMASEELSAGLYDLLQALDFLHSKLGICHNNVCLSSVFVSSDGSWKLGGMEHACRFGEATQEYLEKWRAFRSEDSLSPEEKTNNIKVDGARGHARDVFAFGALVQTILDTVKEKDDLLSLLEQQLTVCSSAGSESRPTVSTLLNFPVFKSDLRDIVSFLQHIPMKNEHEKKEFFSTLLSRLWQIPEQTIARRLVVPLLARFVLLDESANKFVIPHLLMPKGGEASRQKSAVEGLLSESLFRQHVINHLYNIFHVHDCHIRLVLLEHFSHYAGLFTRQQLEDDIFLQILLGVRDTDDRIIAASLRALSDLVPILGGDFIIGGSRKPFFFHGQPKKVSPKDLEKMDVPLNITSMLASHKPLLKTLAAESINNKVETDKKAAERERKARERQQRRDEAKLKREEMRKKLKEQQQLLEEEQEKAPQSSRDVKTTDLTIEQVEDQELEFKSKLEKLENCDEEESDNDDLKKSIHNSVDDDLEKGTPDWSDWEDADQKISDEIEAELENMVSVRHVESKVQTSPSPYRNQPPPSPPPVKVDWVDIPATTKMGNGELSAIKGVRISAGKSKDPTGSHDVNRKSSQNGHIQGSSVPDSHDINISEDWDNSNWDSVNDQSINSGSDVKSSSSPVGQKSLKLKRTSAVGRSQAKKPTRKNSDDDLGAGYDIKSIEIHAKSEPPELDFFAGMVPNIAESRGKDPLSYLESTSSVTIESTRPVLNSLPSPSSLSVSAGAQLSRATNKLFAVAGNSEEDSKGWGEEEEDIDLGIENV